MTGHRVPLTQAERVAKRFGGIGALHRAICAHTGFVSRSAVYKWLADKERGGSGGRIPAQAIARVCSAALSEGILLTSEDLDPRPLVVALDRYARERARDEGHWDRPVVSTETSEVAPDHAPPDETRDQFLERTGWKKPRETKGEE